jgi:hypothetical protein
LEEYAAIEVKANDQSEDLPTLFSINVDLEYLDENTVRTKCPHCHELVRIKLVMEGSNAGGPKMGH